MTDEDAVEHYLRLAHGIGEKLLEALHTSCDTLGITYFLYSGTLLGERRHRGWIPWDDDIDVAMFREDFEILERNAANVLPEGISFSSFGTSEEHITKIPRLLYLASERQQFARARTVNPPEVRHVALDIFVLDRAPARPWMQAPWQLSNRFCELMVTARLTTPKQVLSESSSLTKRGTELVGVIVSRLAPLSAWKWAHRQSCLLFSHTRSSIYSGSNHFKRRFGTFRLNREDFLPARLSKFGEVHTKAPAETDRILSMMYGSSFLSPPPPGDRVPMHFRNGLTATLDGEHFVCSPVE